MEVIKFQRYIDRHVTDRLRLFHLPKHNNNDKKIRARDLRCLAYIRSPFIYSHFLLDLLTVQDNKSYPQELLHSCNLPEYLRVHWRDDSNEVHYENFRTNRLVASIGSSRHYICRLLPSFIT